MRTILATLAVVAAIIPGVAHADSPVDPAPTLVKGVDLHDATIKKFGSTYYMYGSMYGCGFQWGIKPTPWCGFGVSTAPSLSGPWSSPRRLFSPAATDPSTGRSWSATCGGTGQGCFNPRMVERSGWGADDGVMILWFNAPRHMSDGAANAYNVMGCAGPLGPCGPGAGDHGSFNKPRLDRCPGNGDFGIIEPPGQTPAIICSEPGNAGMDLQRLNVWGSGGASGQGIIHLAGLSHTEGPGGWYDSTTGHYVITYSDQGCGYCAGTPMGYATSGSLTSGWTAPGNVGWGAPVYGRRIFSPNSCGGQPRTVTVIDGQPWQIIDLWVGARNETQANTLITPLTHAPGAGKAGDAGVWVPPVSITCR